MCLLCPVDDDTTKRDNVEEMVAKAVAGSVVKAVCGSVKYSDAVLAFSLAEMRSTGFGFFFSFHYVWHSIIRYSFPARVIGMQRHCSLENPG